MSRALELPVVAVAIAGLGALWLVPGPHVVIALAMLLVLAAPGLRTRLAWVPYGGITAVALAGVALAAAVGMPIAGLAVLLAWLVVHRLLTRKGPGDDRVVVLLSAMMLVLGATVTSDVALAVPLIGWAIAAPIALLASSAPERGTAARGWPVGVAVALLAVLVFVAVPRVAQGPVIAAGPALTGFASEVALGDLIALWEDPTPVARVRIEGPVPEPLRLRGAVLDTFDGRTWTATSPRAPFGAAEAAPDLRVEVIEESVVENVLLVVGEAVGVEGDLPVRIDADGTLWAERPDRPIRYVVLARSRPSDAPVGGSDRARLTALPSDLDPRIAALARALAPAEADGAAIVDGVRALLAEYAYTRTARDRDDEEPLSAFLFDRKRGHCEYFASSAAVLLRARGIPARLVTGFAQGEPTSDGWRFRRAHAHAWVEYHDGTGWRVLDATPGPRPPRPPAFALQVRDALGTVWSRQVVGYDRGVQIAAITGFGRGVERLVGLPATPMPPWLGWGLAGGVTVLGIGGAARAVRGLLARLAGERIRPPAGRVAAAHARAWRALRRKGWAVPNALPPVAAARFVRERAGDAAAPLERLAWLFYAVRYGGADDAALAAEAAACARDADAIPRP